MEMEQFDALTRRLTDAGPSRRSVLRALAGGLLGGALAGVVARLGLTEDAEARSKPRKGKPKTKHAHHAAKKSQADRRPGGVQSEGKGKKKKHTKPKPPKPQICSLFECVDQGGKCCPDGACVNRLVCCPGEKQCGEQCVAATACCPGETPCADGSCPAPGQCCKEEYRCDDGTCIAPLDECCPGQKMCAKGSCVAKDTCCPGSAPTCGPCEEAVCDGGAMVCRPKASLDACQQCPAEAVVCPDVPGQYWPIPGIPLPDGCCPVEKYVASTPWGRPMCAAPWSGGTGWWCD